MENGIFNPDYFRQLQSEYLARTGYNLVLSDLNGSIQMGLPDCERFPCMQSCRECREYIVFEAIRTGRVCIDACHQGYILWGLPLGIDGKVVGGLVVIGGEQDLHSQNGHFHEACSELYGLMLKHKLLPEGDLPQLKGQPEVCRFVFRAAFTRMRESIDRFGPLVIEALQTAEFDQARDAFGHLRAAFDEGTDVPMDLVRGLVGDLLFLARRKLIEAGFEPYACTAEAGLLSVELSRAKSLARVGKVLENFLERFIQLSRQKPKDPDDLLIQKATTYLEEHVRDELTRETVARAVGISPSHFSRLIREKKGRTFTDLLNQYRIEHACKLLVRSSHSIAEIANEAGFCDQSYFSKVFRRYKDISPARYRETHRL